VPTIITFTLAAARTAVTGQGRSLIHECQDGHGNSHRQRLALGSVRGIFYLDAICLHCGAHFVWVDQETPAAGERREDARERR
jgi:hypothetical protein